MPRCTCRSELVVFCSKCGLAIIELLVVIAITGSLAGMAYSSLGQMLRGSMFKSSASDLALALKLTRSSTINFNDRITMCRSLNGATCNTQPDFWEDG